MLLKPAEVFYFGIQIIVKIICIIKITTALVNHNLNILPPILHVTEKGRHSKALKEAATKDTTRRTWCKEFNKNVTTIKIYNWMKHQIKTTLQEIRSDFHCKRKGQNPPSHIFRDLLMSHFSMWQLSGEGEMQPKQLQGIIDDPCKDRFNGITHNKLHLQETTKATTRNNWCGHCRRDFEVSLTTNYTYKKLMINSLNQCSKQKQ